MILCMITGLPTLELRPVATFMHRLRNDLYCVEWDVNSSIPYHTFMHEEAVASSFLDF